MRSGWVALALAAASCGGSPVGDDAGAPVDASAAADLAAFDAGSGIGLACQRAADPMCTNDFTPPGVQGSCAENQVCILADCHFVSSRAVDYEAWTGGYCTQDCAGANGHPDSSLCPDDALCSSSDRKETQQCLRACASDADCLGRAGYTCQVDGLGAYADIHLAQPRGQARSCRPNTACAPSGPEPDAGFLNQPVPLAPGVLAAAEGNVAFDGKDRVVVTYIGYWPHDQIVDGNVVALACTLDQNRNCTWSAPTAQAFGHPAIYKPSITIPVDPSVAYDGATSADFYWAWLDHTSDNSTTDFVRVARSTDGGATWSTPVDAATAVTDKPWIAARAGTVWTVACDTGEGLRVSRSTDAGQSWTQHRLRVAGEVVGYPLALVDGAGNLFVVWLGAEVTQDPATEEHDRLRVAMWPAGTPCAQLPSDADCFVGMAVVDEKLLFDEERIDDVPYAAALDPVDNSVWLAWIRGDRYHASDVVVARCAVDKSGGSCGAPVRVSQPGATQTCGVRILPAIAFDEAGVASVAWLDNRFGEADRGRVWYARSSDGKNWTESVLSDQPEVFSVGKEWSAGWGGDYIGLAAGGGRVIASWADSRQLAPTGIQPTGFVRQRLFVGVR